MATPKIPNFDSLVQLAKTGLKAKAPPMVNGKRLSSSETDAVKDRSSRTSFHSSSLNKISSLTDSHSSSGTPKATAKGLNDRTQSNVNLLDGHGQDENIKATPGGLSQEDIALLETSTDGSPSGNGVGHSEERA